MFYLAETDRKLREATDNAKTVDDLVLELEVIRRDRGIARVDDWESLLRRDLGDESVVEFREIMAGNKFIDPDSRWFGGLFSYHYGPYTDFRNQSYEKALIWTCRKDNKGERNE